MRKENFLTLTEKIILSACTLFFFWAMISATESKPLWFDELSTWHIAFSDSFGKIIQALIQGADVAPPLYFFFAKISGFIFGINELGLTFPAIAAYWGYLVLLYLYTSKTLGKRIGIYATSIGLINIVYALEARPYSLAILLGLGAFIAWSKATRQVSRRWLWIMTMSACLALSFLAHWYACIFLLPIFFGEVTRIFKNKKVDFPIFFGVLASLSAFVISLPLIRAAQKFKEHFWSQGGYLHGIPDSYKFYLGDVDFPRIRNFLACLVISLITYKLLSQYSHWFKEKTSSSFSGSLNYSDRKIPAHELVALCTFALTPIFVYLISFIVKAYVARYSFGLAIGVPILIAYMIGKISFKSRIINSAISVIVISFFLFVPINRFKGHVEWYKLKTDEIEHCIAYLSTKTYSNPYYIATTDAFLFTRLYHYAPAELRDRIVYPSNQQVEIQYKKHDADFRTVSNLTDIYYLPVQDFQTFVENNEFWIIGKDPRWLGEYVTELNMVQEKHCSF